MEVLFHTIVDEYDTRPGWNLSWVAMTPGECQRHPAPRMHYSSIDVTTFIIIDDCQKAGEKFPYILYIAQAPGFGCSEGKT